MAKRVVKPTGKGTEVNGEGNEKDDGTSTTVAELATYVLRDDDSKVAGLANGYRQHAN